MRVHFKTLIIAWTACLPLTSWAQSGDVKGEIQTPPPNIKSPPAPPLKPEDALKTLHLPPGFHAELIASDPLLFDPVAISIGADGKIWVVEMRAYMPNVDGTGENAPIGTVATLEDTNGDGRMDKRTEFAGGFVLPRAVAAIGDGVLVAEPPHLWFLKDTNGDGKADQRIEVATDYGNSSSPEHTANGLMWALDNWIYSANHTVRFKYNGGWWQRDTTSFRGQWGITQDDFGQLYYNSNSDPLRTDVLPAEYLRRNEHLIDPRGTNVQLAKPQDVPVWPGRVTIGVNRGYKSLREDGTLETVTAACGPVIYRGALFPPSFRGNAFIAEPAGNLVKRLVLEQHADEPTARNAYVDKDFLTSTDERFRPVSLYNAPDGSLYVVDMYRGVIQHRIFVTTYLRNQIKERGLEAPIGMGRIYRIVPDGAPRPQKLDLAARTSVKLVAALSDAQGWVRDTAQRLLVERNDAHVVSALRTLATKGESSLGRLHALWTLDGMNQVDVATLDRALADPDVHIAQAAIRLYEPYLARNPEASLRAINARASWGEPLVLRQLALSLGAAPEDVADRELVKLAQRAGDRIYMSDAIVSGVAGREARLIDLLAKQTTTDRAVPHVTPVIATAAAAVLKSNDAAALDALLANFSPGVNAKSWLLDAVLAGIEKLIPPNDRGVARTAFIAAEPKALIAFSKGDSPQAARAAQVLQSLRWRGFAVDPDKALAALNDQQRALYEKGRGAFAVCAACHQPQGQGMPGLAPALAGSRWVNGGIGALGRIVLNGKTDGDMTMPPLHALDDETIAAILTYIRHSWGHEAEPVMPPQVRRIRTEVGSREEPWTEAELAPMN
jgi:putative membrane-bound dehydrogenase-like protein